MPQILVTGASGFIGSRTVVELRASGFDTIGLGRRQLDDPDYYAIDLSQPIPDAFRRHVENVSVIIHGAARSSPWGSARAFRNANVVATANVIRLAQSIGTPTLRPKLIFISSSSVYYEPRDQFDITESTPHAKHAVNRYAATKQLAEKLVRNYEGPWVIFRPRAVYGVGDSVLFPRILTAAKAERFPLLIRSGQPAIGDLLSIDNLTHCLKAAAADRALVGEFNLTDNEPVSIIEFLLQVFQRLSIPAPKRHLSVDMAYRMAWLIEHVYGCLMPHREPPITRFGVHVFAYSKTFRVDKMIDTFGPPKFSLSESVDRFVEWVKTHDPYRS